MWSWGCNTCCNICLKARHKLVSFKGRNVSKAYTASPFNHPSIHPSRFLFFNWPLSLSTLFCFSDLVDKCCTAEKPKSVIIFNKVEQTCFCVPWKPPPGWGHLLFLPDNKCVSVKATVTAFWLVTSCSPPNVLTAADQKYLLWVNSKSCRAWYVQCFCLGLACSYFAINFNQKSVYLKAHM